MQLTAFMRLQKYRYCICREETVVADRGSLGACQVLGGQVTTPVMAPRTTTGPIVLHATDISALYMFLMNQAIE